MATNTVRLSEEQAALIHEAFASWHGPAEYCMPTHPHLAGAAYHGALNAFAAGVEWVLGGGLAELNALARPLDLEETTNANS